MQGARYASRFSASPRLRGESLCLPQQNRRRLYFHRHPARRLRINPAINQRLRHHSDRPLDLPEIPKSYSRLRQQRPPCFRPTPRHVLLRRMAVADVRAFFRRRLALLPIPPEHLAPPVIRIPGLRTLAVGHSHLIVAIHHRFLSDHARSPDHQMTRSGALRTRPLPPYRSTMIPKHLHHSSPAIRLQIGVESSQTGLDFGSLASLDSLPLLAKY